VSDSQAVYNPLDKKNLGESIATALLRVKVRPLADTKGLVGAGVYALYYTGRFDAYLQISERNRDDRFEMPIYVGKADPVGVRKGGQLDAGTGGALRNRLADHRRSLKGTNLAIEDFHFRALVVDEVWNRVGESSMIDMFKPLWNVVVDGFGNNAPGEGRDGQEKSLWDTLHPGRKSARDLPDNSLSESDIRRKIAEFLRGRTDLVTVKITRFDGTS
jgi:hypothetical protein